MPLPRDVTSPHLSPPHPWEVECIGFARVWPSCLASQITWRRTKKVRRIQEQYRRERRKLKIKHVSLMLLYSKVSGRMKVSLRLRGVLRGRRTQCLCNATIVIIQTKIFFPFVVFQRKGAPVKLAIKFLGKESLTLLNQL